MSAKDCFDIVRHAAGRDMSDEEVGQIFERLEAHRKRIEAEGDIAGLDRKLREAAKEEGEWMRLAAARERRNTALTIIARDRVERQIGDLIAAGMDHDAAVLSILEGTTLGTAGARKSVAAYRQAFEARFVGGMMAEVQRSLPHAAFMLRDDSFMADIVREMAEMKPDGRPGRTGNADARAVAEIFSKWLELSRLELNRLGAAIGHMSGFAGPQVHDPYKLLGVTEDEWIDAILPRLDMERTFGRDQSRIDALGARRDGLSAQRSAAQRDLRDATISMDRRREQIARMEASAERWARMRDIEAARLDERQSEAGAQIGRLMDNRQSRRAAARENSVALNRLRRRGEGAHDRLARIEGKMEALRQKLAGQRERLAADEKAADAVRARLAEIEPEWKRLDIEEGGLRRAVDDPREFLRQAYRTIVTGRDSAVSAAGKGDFVGPANLARSLGKHRVLHFKSADDWLAYHARFGHGSIFSSMIAHQSRMARLAAQMDVLGPNPDALMGSVLDKMQRQVRDDTSIPNERRAEIEKRLTMDPFSRIGAAMSEARGLTLSPASVKWAQIGSTVRAVQSMAKLGRAVISSVSDLVTSAANLTYHGKPFLQAWGDQIGELRQGRGSAQAREIAYLIGEGFDGLIGHIVSPHVAADGAPGLASKAMETYFRWSGLTWWTDARRAGAARMLSAWVGSNVGKAWGDLPPRFRHGLTLHGIDKNGWEAIRQAQFRSLEGRTYVTPDRIAALPDAAVDGMIPAADIAAARAAFRLDEPTMKQFGRDIPVSPEMAAARQEKFDGWVSRRRDGARRDLEMAMQRYFADETSFAVIEADDRTRRQMYWGTRPGTVIGEGLRFLLQFKAFPFALTTRVGGRALFGGMGDTRSQRLMHNARHIGHLLAGLTIAGYMAMTAKDLLSGWWPPRNPLDYKTWISAMAQGGGLGIYGDFLFGQASRFGNSGLESLAGPNASTLASLINVWTRARDGDPKAGDYFNLMMQNTPFANLWYARPALDWMVLNSLHETVSPGYLSRQERSRRREMGQTRMWEAKAQ